MRTHGFSLVELLAVLTVVALVAVLASTSLFSSRAAMEERSAIGHMADVLRRAREHAITSTEDIRFVLDLDTRRYAVAGTKLSGELPLDSAVTFRTALDQVISARRASITFNPDGTTSGATIAVAFKNRSWRVTISWLTGRVLTREI